MLSQGTKSAQYIFNLSNNNFGRFFKNLPSFLFNVEISLQPFATSFFANFRLNYRPFFVARVYWMVLRTPLKSWHHWRWRWWEKWDGINVPWSHHWTTVNQTHKTESQKTKYILTKVFQMRLECFSFLFVVLWYIDLLTSGTSRSLIRLSN